MSPAVVYDADVEAWALPMDIVKAVDDIAVPDGYTREGYRGLIETRHVSDSWKCGGLSLIFTQPPED